MPEGMKWNFVLFIRILKREGHGPFKIGNQKKYSVNPEIVQECIEDAVDNAHGKIALGAFGIFEDQSQRAKEDPIQHGSKNNQRNNQQLTEHPQHHGQHNGGYDPKQDADDRAQDHSTKVVADVNHVDDGFRWRNVGHFRKCVGFDLVGHPADVVL